mgnify:CR=1 FL=1
MFRIITLYGFSIIFGFITTLILGQTYKTLPFIVWLYKYKSLVGKAKTPLPRELYSNKIASVQMIAYFLFITTMVMGLLVNNIILVRIGAYLLIVVAVLYNLNVLRIVRHKVKTEKL